MSSDPRTIPIGQVLEKLDGYFAVNDIPSAEKHLLYWLSEAEKSGSDSAKLTILNEMTGLYRNMGKKAEGLQAIDDLLALLASMQIEDSVPYATTLLNAATGLRAFGKAAESIPLYEKAGAIYESLLPENDEKLAGLCAAETGPVEAEEQINAYMDEAEKLLDSENLKRDGHYAFVCRKCARAFEYYGRFATEAELLKRAENITT